MLLLLVLLCAMMAALLFNASITLTEPIENMIAIPILVMGQIIIATQLLSMLHSIGMVGYSLAHLVMLGLSVAIWFRAGKPSLRKQWVGVWRGVLLGRRRHPRIFLLAVGVLTFVAYQALYGALNETYFVDAFTYHIPRALFWVQNGTAEHFFTQNFRITEFPPNASFIYTWILTLSGQYLGLNLPQAIAGLVIVAATAALARRAGASWDASLSAGLMAPLTLELGRQLAEAQIDVITAALSTAMIVFVLSSFAAHRQGVALRRNAALMYLAIAFGLAVGTKLTVVFLLPGAAIGLGVYALRILRGQALSILVACAVAAMMGFAVFGSYNYVLNWQNFGNPITASESSNSSDLISRGFVPASTLNSLQDPAANLVRYFYQLSSIQFLQGFSSIDLEEVKTQLFDGFFQDTLGVDYRINGLPLTEFATLRLFFLIVPTLMILSVGLFVRFVWTSHQEVTMQLRATYIFVAWSWLFLLAMLITWDQSKIRFFIIVVPLLLAAVIPQIYPRRLSRLALFSPFLLFALFNIAVNIAFSDPTGDETIAYVETEMAMLLADADQVAFMGDQLSTYHLMTRLPDREYQFVTTENMVAALATGEVDAVLAAYGLCDFEDEAIQFYDLEVLISGFPECLYLPSASAEGL